ncbi:MAG TPA: F0F1 ATP synthase subunit I [Rhodobacteraceae bacterium]|jgi:ATP synthase protein I|nr:F0F1 ATP synthase subunit I [Paracoccaceae bacterium]
MSDTPDPELLAQLEKRIAAVKKTHEPDPKEITNVGQMEYAWRMIIELMVGICIGFGIGYWLDVFFDTMPWFLVLFTLLGFAAGVNVMLKTAKELQQDNAAQDAGNDEGK